jgi:ERF superfamily protein
MSDTPDEQDAAPVKRQTAMQVATDANALALAHDEQLEALSEKVTDLASRLAELRDPDPLSVTMEEDALADQIDAAIDRKMPTATSMDGFLARLEAAERAAAEAKVSGKAPEMWTDAVNNLSARLAVLEKSADESTTWRQHLAQRLNEQNAETVRALDNTHHRLQAVEAALIDARNEARSATSRDELDAVVVQLSEVAGDVEKLNKIVQSGTDRALVSANPSPGVHGKVMELMRTITAIGKDRQTDRKAGGYSFRGVDDAMDAVGHALRQVGLVLLPGEILARDYAHHEARNNDGKTIMWTTAMLSVRYAFIDPDDGSTLAFEMVGEGRAMDDKATSKATSMALKYGLFQALMIPVTGLDDADAESPQVVRSAGAAEQPAPLPTAQDRAGRARAALQAMQNLGKLQPAGRPRRLEQIMEQVAREHLADFVVEGATLRQHAVSIGETLPPTGTKQAPRAEPGPDSPPWDDAP